MDIDRKIQLSELNRIYGALLTEHQREMLRLYYDCDISLFEIAEQLGISRQAVRDAIVRGEKTLLDFEDKLKLSQRQTKRAAELKQLNNLLREHKVDDAICFLDRLQGDDREK